MTSVEERLLADEPGIDEPPRIEREEGGERKQRITGRQRVLVGQRPKFAPSLLGQGDRGAAPLRHPGLLARAIHNSIIAPWARPQGPAWRRS